MNKDLLLSAAKKIPELDILVIGDVMVDIYDFCYTSSSRPSPEKKDKLVYTSHKTIRTLGGAGNVAANLSALGVKTKFISIAGNDGYFHTLKTLADTAGLEYIILQDEKRPTTTKFRLYIDDAYILRRDDEDTLEIDNEITAKLKDKFNNSIAGCNAVIISDYNKGFFTREFSQFIIKKCRKDSIPVIVDFKPDNLGYFESADIIAPNSVEAKALVCSFNRNDPESSAGELYEKLKCSNLIITLGSKGICGYDGDSFFQYPVLRVEAKDPVGCGDTVRVGLAVGTALGFSLRESAALANAAAAAVVQKTGTATLDLGELREMIKRSS